MRIESFIEQTSRAKSLGDLTSLLSKAANSWGITRFAYGCLRGDFPLLDPSMAPAITLNYPEDWVRHYFVNEFYLYDPVVRLAPDLAHPFVWSSLRKLTPRAATILRLADEAGLHQGFSVPIHGPGGDCFVMSFAQDSQHDLPPRTREHFALLSFQLHSAYLRLANAPLSDAPRLSPNAIEALKWTRDGKTAEEIASTLGITRDGVNFLRNEARRKLGCRTLSQAVVEAIRRGIISI